jgi:hypothetical protein
MSNLTRKEFERLYSAELLPHSFADTTIGDQWDWKGFIFNRHLKSLFSNVAGLCADDNLLSLEKNVALVDANIATIDVTDDFKSDATLKIPTIDLSLSTVLDKDKVENMSFINVQGRNGTSVRAAMTAALNKLKDQDFDAYKTRVRNTEVIMGLFYAGSISITVSKSITNKEELEAKLGAIPGVNLSVDVSDAATYKYSLNNSATPFAASFIEGRDI